MTAPLTPPDCDLQDFLFMPLDVRRLRDSSAATSENPEEFRAAVLLWCAAWHQVPAGSLDNNDKELANLAGFGRFVGEWLKVKEGALRGFVECDDGRLYHRVVCEKALEAWGERLEYRKRSAKGNAKRHGNAFDPGPIDAAIADNAARLAALLSGDLFLMPPTRTAQGRDPDPPRTEAASLREVDAVLDVSQGTGTGTDSSVSNETGAEAPANDGIEDDQVLADLRELPVAKACWRLAVKVLTERGGQADPKARAFVGRLKGMGLTDDDLWSVAEAAWKAGTRDPIPYLTKAAEGVVDRRAGRTGIEAPSERQQRSWMEDWAAKGPAGWRKHERGPYPTEVGCRVSSEILAEFGIPPAEAA